MSNSLTKGNIYRIEAGQFAIVSYYPTTMVYVALLDGIDTVSGAIKTLSEKHPETEFVMACTDTEKWGELFGRDHGYTLFI